MLPNQSAINHRPLLHLCRELKTMASPNGIGQKSTMICGLEIARRKAVSTGRPMALATDKNR